MSALTWCLAGCDLEMNTRSQAHRWLELPSGWGSHAVDYCNSQHYFCLFTPFLTIPIFFLPWLLPKAIVGVLCLSLNRF